MAEHFDREDVEAVIACLGDDAAQLRQENDEDERAENMDRAASMLTWMLLTHPAYAPGVRVDAPVSRDSLPMGWNVAVEMSRQTPRTGQVVLDCAVVLKVDERLTNGVRACETCSGRGEVGGFQGGGAPGYVTDKCPDCKGTGKAGMALDVPDQRNRGLLQAAKQALAALDRDAATPNANLLYEARSCLRPAIEREEAFRAAIGEPDCWAILTPNGSKLVSPEEARGALGAYPLYRAADVALGANPWKEAVLDELSNCCMDAPQDEPPRSILKRVIATNVKIALDPAVSSDAQALIDRGANGVKEDGNV